MSERPTHPWVAEGADRVRFAIGDVFLEDWWETVAFVRRAEQLGFDSYWANDHPNRIVDTWTKLAALGIATERIRLISLVSCVFYRSPYLLARQSADVDRISGGRLVLGIGIGDDETEFREMGVPFLPNRKRQQAMKQALDVIQGLWTGRPFTYHGEFFDLANAVMTPSPVQTPHIPVLIGGGGERVTLRQVAERADVSNMSPHEWAGSAFSADDVARKYDVLRRHCHDVGREFDSILRTHYTPLLTLAPDENALKKKRRSTRIPDAERRTVPVFATPEQAVEHYQRLVDVGVQYFLMLVNGHDDETVDLLVNSVMTKIHPRSSDGP